MENRVHTQAIKEGPNRSVRVETDPGGCSRVVKRYRAQGWLQRFGDRARAEREFRVLTELHGRGLPVPRPLGLTRCAGAWELACEWIPGAKGLDRWLGGGTNVPEPVGPHAPARLARRIGATLARAHVEGLDHGDLHPGNVLIDGEGCVWLIDFARARILGSSDPAVMRRDLLALGADARERIPLALRRRAFVAWWRALDPATQRRLPTPGQLATEIEAELRERRRTVLAAHSDRWRRESGLCRQERIGGESCLVARDVDDLNDDGALTSLLALRPSPELQAGPGGRGILVLADDGTLEETWVEAGIAHQHALRSARPLVLTGERQRRAFFELPPMSRRMNGVNAAEVTDAAWGRLLGSLHDRGFVVGNLNALWYTPTAELVLGPGAGLRPGSDCCAPAGIANPRAFRSAFLAEWRGSRVEGEALARSLENG